MSTQDNNLPTNDAAPAPGVVTRWIPLWAVCFILAILFVITGVIIASLIPVYLQTKDGGITEASSSSASRNIPIQFATNPPLSASQTPTNLAEIGEQISKSLGYPADTLGVQSSSSNGDSNEKRKKRQTITVSPVCGQNNSLSLAIFVNKCPNTTCNTEYCFQKCVVNIKIDIQSKLGTNAIQLTLVTANKTTTIVLAIFCSFQQLTTTLATTRATTRVTTSGPPLGCNDCYTTVITYYKGGGMFGDIVGTQINCATFCAGTFGDSVNLVGTDFPFGNVDFTRYGTAAINYSHASGYTCRVNTTKPSGTCVTSYGDPNSDVGQFSITAYGNSIVNCRTSSSPFYFCCCQEKTTTATVVTTTTKIITTTTATTTTTTETPRVWKYVASMSVPRHEHAASLLSNGTVLVIGGQNGSVRFSSAELYNAITNVWTATKSMSATRVAHTASALSNGKVLVTGGFNGAYLNSAELYDPASGNWTLTGNMINQRCGHAASTLPNGKVLVTGGSNGVNLKTAELYDPTLGNWMIAANMSYERVRHQSVVLSTGKVLVIGGAASKSAELYDPSTGSWTVTGSMSAVRAYHTATLLSNGKVLVTGGDGNTAGVTTELYEPSTNNWTLAASMNIARQLHVALKLSNGKVLVSGGSNSGDLASSELYDPSANTWTIAANMSVARSYHLGVVLSNGSALVFGGKYLASAELY